MKLMPIERMALDMLGWAILVTLSFFFHVIGFLVVLIILGMKTMEFKFVYENTRDINTPEEESYVRVHDSRESDRTTDECYISEPTERTFPELGAEWEGRVRENLSEGEARWHKRVLG